VMDCDNQLRAQVVCVLMVHAQTCQSEARGLTCDVLISTNLPEQQQDLASQATQDCTCCTLGEDTWLMSHRVDDHLDEYVGSSCRCSGMCAPVPSSSSSKACRSCLVGLEEAPLRLFLGLKGADRVLNRPLSTALICPSSWNSPAPFM